MMARHPKQRKAEMTIKRTWIVTSMDTNPLADDNGKVTEFKSEKAALAKAEMWVNESEDNEAWVFMLSHVVERPTGPTS